MRRKRGCAKPDWDKYDTETLLKWEAEDELQALLAGDGRADEAARTLVPNGERPDDPAAAPVHHAQSASHPANRSCDQRI